MSRCVVKPKDPAVSEMVVGLDKAPYPHWFVQVWFRADVEADEDAEPRIWKGFGMPGGDDEISQSEMLELMQRHADLDDPKTKRVYNRIGMDLDPGEDEQ